MRITNRSWRNGARILYLIAALCLVGAFAVFLSSASSAIGNELVEVAVLDISLLLIFRLARIPMTQPYIEISKEGIHYGAKQFVPWAAVSRVARRGGPLNKRLVVLTTEWHASGPLGALISRAPLPLSKLDGRRSIDEWLEPFRIYAPTLPLP